MTMKAVSLVEVLVVIFIFSAMLAGIYTIFNIGYRSWEDAEASIQLQQDIRKSVMKISRDLRQSGCSGSVCDAASAKLTIGDDTGVNNTDILNFKIAVDTDADGFIDLDGSDNYQWGSALTWGCSGAGCHFLNYQTVYLVNSDKHLIRRVLDDTGGLVRDDIVAINIEDFQVTRAFTDKDGDGNNDSIVVSIEIDAQKYSVFRRLMSATLSFQIELRNRG